MEQKAFFRLLLVVTFIGLSCIFFAASVPATRSQLISNMEDPPAVQHQPSHQVLSLFVRHIKRPDKLFLSFTMKPIRSCYSEAKSKDAVDLKADDDFFELEEGLLKGRMIVELADYPEPGANRGHQPGHQPKTPGKP
ncbi:hypothetical protein O6P43_009924 [Quillaja saponaria]|uniref:Transmembrane protein n=1 Tax=Quillaja saponaria TaxID=32244 RepID=A0AAD7PZC4_QUISA|nr:hypothetical protein O6P43_009924 [Quillaja saponaria]